MSDNRLADDDNWHDPNSDTPDRKAGEVSVAWSRSARDEDCALCKAGLCVQRVATLAGGSGVVLHGRTRN